MFKADLDQKLKCTTGSEYSGFQSIFTQVLYNYAPTKKKFIRFNNSPFMTKTLRKAIMHRSKLKNIYNKKRTDDSWANYKKQRNFCVNLLCKTKKDCFQNLNIQDLSNKRKFWKTIKPHFTNEGINSNKLLFKEKGNLASNKKQLATIMDSSFINITKDLELKEYNESNANTLEDVLGAYNSNSSIERIRRTIKTNEKFSFQPVPEDLVHDIILNLDHSVL